jgi:hypothetical protein
MSTKFTLCVASIFVASTFLQVLAADEACGAVDSEAPAGSSALLQVVKKETGKARTCSFELQGDQDGTQTCDHLEGKTYTSGRNAPLDESGYQQTAALCCHHEMSLFARREIARQGLDVCDLSDLHGFIHWYDCTNDTRTYAEFSAEIAASPTSNCPFLGKLPNCPVQHENCHDLKPCEQALAKTELNVGATQPLDQSGYARVAKVCCHVEMERFIRREIDRQGFEICDEGALKGFLAWFDCESDGQTYERLKDGIIIARSGLPPMCPWLGSKGGVCPPTGHNCPWVEVPEPEAHRRRTACR